MTPIEITTLVFAGLVVLKLLAVLISPKAWMAGVTTPLLKHSGASMVLYQPLT